MLSKSGSQVREPPMTLVELIVEGDDKSFEGLIISNIPKKRSLQANDTNFEQSAVECNHASCRARAWNTTFV